MNIIFRVRSYDYIIFVHRMTEYFTNIMLLLFNKYYYAHRSGVSPAPTDDEADLVEGGGSSAAVSASDAGVSSSGSNSASGASSLTQTQHMAQTLFALGVRFYFSCCVGTFSTYFYYIC